MKELDILRVVMQDAEIGWWEFDMSRGMLRLSDTLQGWFDVDVEEIGLEELQRFVLETYLKYTFSEIDLFTEGFPRERTIPLNGAQGPMWVTWKVLHKETNADGHLIVCGYLRKNKSQKDSAAQQEASSMHIDNLLFRLNSISHSLLSLLNTDKVDVALHRILNDILTLFHGGRAYIVEFDWETRTHNSIYEVTEEGVTPESSRVNTIQMDETPWWTDRIARGLPVILSDLSELPVEAFHEKEILAAQHIKSLIVMPLHSRDKVRGYVGIDVVDEQHIWTNEDCQWFASLVNIISLCLELQRSELEANIERDYLERLYRHMPLGYVRMRYIYDKDNQPCDYLIVDTNKACDTIVGLSREQYIGHTARELGLNIDTHLAVLTEVSNSGQYTEFDTQLNPSQRFIRSIVYATSKDEVVALLSDTTALRKTNEALLRNEKMLRSIFDNIPVGVEFYDSNGGLVDLNKKDMEIFGVLSKTDVLGVNFFDNPIVPQHIRDNVRRGEEQSFRLDYPFNKLGTYYNSGKTGFIQIYTSVSIINDSEGKCVNFMLINIDNTEINRAHSQLAEFESSFSLVSRFGLVGYCRYDLLAAQGFAIPQWFVNLGEDTDTPLSEIIGSYRYLDPADRKTLCDSLERLKAGQIDTISLDLRVYPPSGEELWTRTNVMRNPMNNDPSKIEIVSVNYDITALKKTEKNLIEAKNKAEVSDRLKSAFLANMSHEIRTPLNAIVGFSNLMTTTNDPDEQQEYLRIVEENNDLLLKLISDILDLSKIEAGTFEFNYGVVDINRMCEEIVRSLGLKVQDSPVSLCFGAHEEQCAILGDKNRLMQVITNFINNAIKFTEQGSITLSYDIEGDHVRFKVADTGKGIAPEQQVSVFERFVKLNSFAQGTGLGLSICKSIVEQMKGKIGVESTVGEGSCFWFSVPIGTHELLVPEEEQLHEIIIDGKRCLLLVAEDTDSNFLLISLMLRKEYEIRRAVTGVEAVQACRQSLPDAVLMDIKMPEMDGLEATRCIRKSYPRLPIIAVTAFTQDCDMQKALDAGCDDFLTKPVSGEQLRQKLRKLIRRK